MKEDFPIYVKHMTFGGELSSKGFEGIMDAKDYIATELLPLICRGDSIVIVDSEE